MTLTNQVIAKNVSMEIISWADFERIELGVGTILSVAEFPEARKPADQFTVDFGPEIGIKRSSAQSMALYQPETLVGRQILDMVNFPPKQIGPLCSVFLVTGLY